MASFKLIAASVLLGAASVFLAIPELLPGAYRISSVTLLTAGALLVGVFGVSAEKRVRWGVCLFAGAVMVSWWMTPERDPVALRHLSGIGLGVMVTGVVARWCTNERRLITVAVLFALAASGVLLRGSLSAFNSSLAPAASKLVAPEFRAIPLNLPGTEPGGGYVNTNALGGTAVIVLPACIALAVAAALITPRRRRFIALAAGSGASGIAGLVVLMTLSRSAIGAAAVTVVTLGLRWQRGRRWVLVALLLAGGGLVYGTHAWRDRAPEDFDRRLAYSANIRMAILQDGLDRLRESPWLGIGISQFRAGDRASRLYGTHQLPHAHNIFLQVALDVGLAGLAAYVLTFAQILVLASRAAVHTNAASRIAAGAGLSLVAVHAFGLTDAVALGAKVGVFQWWSAGLVIAASRLSTGPAENAERP